MTQINTLGIVLTRVDFQEADRIVHVMTPDRGKISLLAKGVRRIKSKLAGGIELFSVAEITYLEGRKDLHTLISARLLTHYGEIAKNLERTTFGYRVLKVINKVTEDNAEGGYFTLLKQTLEQLNDASIPLHLIDVWFTMQLLQLMGNTPNLGTDTGGSQLVTGDRYTFELEAMGFSRDPNGLYNENHVKIMRLMLQNPPQALRQIKGIDELAQQLCRLSALLLQKYS